jgi:saccharopine dehydrogenase (NAD+, L-lysine-forming)
MANSKVIVLGGAGAMAQVTIRDLLGARGIDRIGVADVRLGRATEISRRLRSDKLEAIEVDARQKGSLIRELRRWDVLVNSTWYELNLVVMNSAISAGIHYIDLGGLYHYTLKQLMRNKEAKDAGVTCVLGIGSSPGLTNVMAAHLGKKFSKIRSVKIRSAASAAKGGSMFRPPYSIRTILDEGTMPAVVLRDGKIRKVPALSGKETFVMPEPIGRVEGFYTLHSELATLPKSLGRGVSMMDFIVAFSPEFTRSLALLIGIGLGKRKPIEVGGARISPYDVLTKVIESAPVHQTRELNVAARRVEIYGEIREKEVMMRIDCISRPNRRWGIDGRSIGTGIPPSIVAQWLGEGRIRRRGVLPPELCIESVPFFRELASHDRGIEIHESAVPETGPSKP